MLSLTIRESSGANNGFGSWENKWTLSFQRAICQRIFDYKESTLNYVQAVSYPKIEFREAIVHASTSIIMKMVCGRRDAAKNAK